MERIIILALALPIVSMAYAAETQPATTKPATSQPASQPASKPAEQKSDRVVIIDTNKGKIVIELTPERTPTTVKNFLRYVDEKFYDGTIFHRVIKGFMIQGGGFTADLEHKTAHDPIKNETKGALPNNRGTISMARTNDPDSATCEFFINHVDNEPLNTYGGGYCVFGKVIEGMDVVDDIAEAHTKRTPPVFEALPVETIKINSIARK
jgi:cyclophilin family peptidyl-prolyl cis-trans isomerase